jgi:type IX secretion system PorP/SprF family membrane protein
MQFSYSQEDGVVSLAIPVRNSLRYNRFLINPTFSFVREQNRNISFTNKREWVQFDDAPLTYLASYSGRFKENIGVGVGLFQQNYGVLSSFGGVLNFAYNARLQTDSNLTFGLNLGFYNSGINEGKVITNFPDPSLNNIPSNSVLSISPGINYGIMFFDFGISVNNAVQYNLKTSQLIENDPKQGIQAHVMYTGYMDFQGFLDESKFSGLIKSEFQKDQTIISGIAMLTVPKGIWGQVGYNTVYGVSGGIGLNITSQIAIEYNYEKAIGDLSVFGSSHEITLAYKFKNNDNFDYSGNEEEVSLLIQEKSKRVLAKPTMSAEDRAIRAQEKKDIALKAQIAKEERLTTKAKAQALAIENAKLGATAAAVTVTKTKADEDARIAAEKLEEIELQAKAKDIEDERIAAEVIAKAKADEDARIAAEKLEEIELQAKAKEAEDARIAAEVIAKAKADEDVRIAEEKLNEIELKAKADKKARLEAEAVILLEITHKDEIAKEMFELTELTKASRQEQEELLARLTAAIEDKNKDLKDLKEENDLSEQGVYQAPKPFKSVSAQNKILEGLKLEVDASINTRNKNIEELETQYKERLKKVSNKDDATNAYYRNAIQQLKDEQKESVRSKASLVSKLETINVELEFERNRRIKRAVYDNEEDKYQKERAVLNKIKENTIVGSKQYSKDDFDFGINRTLDNIQIVKDVKHFESGYYIVLAVHNDVKKRDEFLTKTISAGQANINFFYDVKTSKYYIYYKKFTTINEAKKALQLNETEPYNSEKSLVKIEN